MTFKPEILKKMHVLQSSDNEIIFMLTDSTPSIAHALKRTMESDVPTMAIHMVQVIDNTSVLPDEMIVNRLGLIPLYSGMVDQFLYNHECDCETIECNKCSVNISLNVVCYDDFCNVTSRDLMFKNHKIYPIHHSGIPSELRNGNESILIAKLKKNQKIRIKCVAKKGTGSLNAKWSPTVGLVVRSVPNKKVDTELYKKCTKQKFCVHELSFNQSNGCLKPNGAVCLECNNKIDFGKNVSLFKIESVGSLSPTDILNKSIQIMKNRIYRLLDEIKK
jgi:DNA-directed RNA polymerase II subunit RPB3